MIEETMNVTIICRTCRRPLDTVITDEGAGYQHAAYDLKFGDGHEAEPVTARSGEANWRCDFCHADVERPWVFPARQMTWMGELYDTNWVADAKCAELVNGRLWVALAWRAYAGYEKAIGKPMDSTQRAMLFDLWRTFEQHRAGDPIQPEGSS